MGKAPFRFLALLARRTIDPGAKMWGNDETAFYKAPTLRAQFAKKKRYKKNRRK